MMKNLDSIPHTLDGIFRELNRASNIIITFNPAPGIRYYCHCERSDAATASGIRHLASGILEVNGCHTPDEFYTLMSLCAGVRLSTFDAMETLDSSEKAAILIEAIHRVSILYQKIISVTLNVLSCQLICLHTRVEHPFDFNVFPHHHQLVLHQPAIRYQLDEL